MKNENPYVSGTYYEETYQLNKMNLKTSTKWMSNYFKVVRSIFSKILMLKKSKILEIGSGFGGFINLLNERGYLDVTASDLSENIFLREINNNMIKIDLESDEKVDKQYDIIFAFDVMEHVNKTDKAVTRIGRLLNPGGFFIFSTPYPFKKHLLDDHTNMQFPNFYANIFKQNFFKLIEMQDVSFIPFFWRLGLPFFIKVVIKNKFFVSETFFVFKNVG